jgi:hypothetical protein
MPRHVDMTAKVFFLGIERRNLAAFIRRQKSFDHRAALTAQLLQNLHPIILRNAADHAPLAFHGAQFAFAGCEFDFFRVRFQLTRGWDSLRRRDTCAMDIHLRCSVALAVPTYLWQPSTGPPTRFPLGRRVPAWGPKLDSCMCGRGRSNLSKNLLLTLAMRVTVRSVFHF